MKITVFLISEIFGNSEGRNLQNLWEFAGIPEALADSSANMNKSVNIFPHSPNSIQ